MLIKILFLQKKSVEMTKKKSQAGRLYVSFRDTEKVTILMADECFIIVMENNKISYVFFSVVLRRMEFNSQRFGTPGLFHLHRRVDKKCECIPPRL
jgi:hypothetical protein